MAPPFPINWTGTKETKREINTCKTKLVEYVEKNGQPRRKYLTGCGRTFENWSKGIRARQHKEGCQVFEYYWILLQQEDQK